MPLQSKAQSRFMHWAAAHPGEAQRERGIKPGAAATFLEHSAGQKVGKLPERVAKADGGSVTTYPAPFRW